MQAKERKIKDAVAKTVCLNCGTECEGVYCPSCGQPTQTPRRITMKTFWKGAAMSFARLTPGFWATFVGLMFRPWDVIRQYIRGKRIKYSPPVTMVIQLLLYFTFFYTVVGNIFHTDLLGVSELALPEGTSWFVKMLMSSDVFFKILVAAVLAFNCYLTYGLSTGRRHNLAEYLTAAIYMGCCFSIYNNLLLPLGLIWPEGVYVLKITAVAVIGTVALNKAFPMKGRWRRWLVWLGFLGMNALAFIVVVLAIAAVRLLF